MDFLIKNAVLFWKCSKVISRGRLNTHNAYDGNNSSTGYRIASMTGIRPTLELYISDCSVGKIVTGLFPVLQAHFHPVLRHYFVREMTKTDSQKLVLWIVLMQQKNTVKLNLFSVINLMR